MIDPPFRLDGRVALVTGAAGLLGQRHCAALAAAGAQVVAVDLNPASCKAVVAQLAECSATAHLGRAANLLDPQDTRALREEVMERYGRVDILVNNAAINDKVEGGSSAGTQSAFEHYPLHTFQQILHSSVLSSFLCCQQFAPVMAEHGGGSIINVASTYALVGPDQRLYQDENGDQQFYKSAAYPTAKAALLGLTRFLAAYYGAAQVRVNSLVPGGVENGQDPAFVARYAAKTPLARMATPDDYRGALLFLASDASQYMTGANLVVDGGFTAW